MRMDYLSSGCGDHTSYGNVDPWRVPASPHDRQPSGAVPDGKLLYWRYTSKDARWAMVFDPAPAPGDTNWYFVERACLTR